MRGKRYAVAGLTAGLLAGGGAGFVLQATGSAGASASITAEETPDTTPDDPATDPADEADDAPRVGARLSEVLQPLVDDGTLTQEQADAVVAKLTAEMPKGRPGGHGGHGRPGGMGRGERLENVAEVIGIDADALRTGLRDGQTIAQIAEANGSSGQAVIDSLVASATERMSEAVANGKLTQEEADAKLAELTGRITEFVNDTPDLPQRD
jgi:polyhydroxyalkanoate synthesis regulator phasin